MVANSAGCTPDGCSHLYMVAGEAASVATETAPMCWLEGRWLEVRAHQKISKVLWPAVGGNRAFWDGNLQASGGMEHWGDVLCDCW